MLSVILCLCTLVVLPISCGGRMHCGRGEYYSHQTRTCVSCPLGQFFNHETQVCTPCSICPINTISRRQCSGDRDTYCRAFIEFDKFHQSSRNKPSDETDDESGDQTTKSKVQTEDQVKLVADGPWYTIAMSLLGVLCVVSVVLAVYVICACFVCKKRRQEKQIMYDPELYEETEGSGSPHNVYSYLHSLLSPGRGNKSRSVDDISEDSGQGTVGRQVIIMPNGYLQPLDSIEYTTDNCGQALSTDYVYFKAPSSATV